MRQLHRHKHRIVETMVYLYRAWTGTVPDTIGLLDRRTLSGAHPSMGLSPIRSCA